MTYLMRVKTTTTGFTSGPGYSNFYFSPLLPGTGVTVEDAEEAHARVQAAWVSARTLFPPDWSWSTAAEVDVLVTESGVLTGTQVGGAVGGDVGTGNAEFAPSVAAICLTYRTATLGATRLIRGRTFLSPVCTDVDDNGVPSAGALTAVTNFGLDLYTTIGIATPQVIWKRPVDGAGGVAAPVTSRSITPQFAILRSRR